MKLDKCLKFSLNVGSHEQNSECQFEISKTTVSEEADWYHVLSTVNIDTWK